MTEGRAIGRAAMVVSAGILASRLLGFLRNIALYSLLGREASTDLYVAAFTIPDYLFFLMAGGYLSITLVPILTRHLAAGDRDAAERAFSSVFEVVAVLLLVLVGVALVLAGKVVPVVFPEVSEVERLVGLTRIALASQVLFGLGTLLMAAQYARQRFLVPTLAPLIYNLGIIIGGLVGAGIGEPSPEAFLWGGLVGAAVGNFGLQWWGAARAGFRFRWPVGRRDPAVAEYFAMALPLMIGQSVVALDEQWPRLFGQFAGPGAIAGLYGARQLNLLPVGVIAQAAGVAAYPFLARLAAEGRHEDLRATVARSSTAVMEVAGLAAGLVVALAAPIVAVAYQYGRFGAADTLAVAPLLAWYGLSIPFWAVHQIYSRGFYSRRQMWSPVVIGTAVTLVTLPALWFLVQANQAVGVAQASTLGVVLYTLAIAVTWHRRSGAGHGRGVALMGGKVAVAGAVSGITAYLIARLIAGTPAFVRLLAGGTAGTLLYLGAARALGMPTITRFLRRLD